MKRKWMGFLMLLMLWVMSLNVLAAEQLFATDVTAASEGCTLVGLRGKYIIQTQTALDRINEIRLEACTEGVLNPGTGKALTLNDYVPIKWSADLEYIAKIRAAESSITMYHLRTNGKSCFYLSSPNGVGSWGEVLAWNWTESVVHGIDQWYREKEDWVAQNTNAVTGHYEQMIDPENLYVGIGTFCTDGARYYNTTAGEFSGVSGLAESSGSGVQSGIQILEVSNEYLTGVYEISGDLSGKIGDVSSLTLTTSAAVTDYWGSTATTSGLLILDGITWSSSDPSVASVSSDGTLSLKYCGSTQISAAVGGNTVATATASVEHTKVTIPAVAATCSSRGLTAGTKCSVCGEILEKQKSVAKTAHTWDEGVITKEPTIVETGTKLCTCSECGTTKTKKISKVAVKKGKIFTVDNLKYRIVSAKTNGKGTVSLAGVSGKKTALKSLKVPKTIKIDGVKFTVTSIGVRALKGCTKLKTVTISSSVTSIGKEAFYGCKSLTGATIGSGVTRIYSRAFMKCTKLKEITIRSRKLTTVGKDAVRSVNSRAQIKVPSSKVNAYQQLFTAKTGFKKTMKVTK